MGRRSKASPSQGRWLGEAGTERLLQICGDLSVSLRRQLPCKGSLWVVVVQGAENDCCFLGRGAA